MRRRVSVNTEAASTRVDYAVSRHRPIGDMLIVAARQHALRDTIRVAVRRYAETDADS